MKLGLFFLLEGSCAGDLLAPDQGHFWGPKWHGGIDAGDSDGWDCSRHGGLNGAYKRPFSGFHYYHKPLHELLLGKPAVRSNQSGVKGSTLH